MKRLSLRVDGIACAGCALDGESVLKNRDGIVDAEINYAAGTVTIDYQPGEIDEKDILGLVQRLGWRIRQLL